jgi:hypothetical protein
MKKRWVLGFLLLSLVLSISVTRAESVLVYNNGLPNGLGGGSEITHFLGAEDFTLSSAQTITDVRFWAFIYTGGSYNGSIAWDIYDDNGGKPGNILFFGLATPTQTFYHNVDSYPGYQYDFSIGTKSLAAGTYWLALHNGPLTSTDDFQLYWESANDNSTLTGYYKEAPFLGDWQEQFISIDKPNENEAAFQLYNNTVVPIPGALWLLGSGLMGLAGWRRLSKS